MKRLFFFLTALTLSACSSSQELRQGKVTLHSTANKDSFIFTVDEKFCRKNKNSPKDKNNPIITKAEASLLEKLLDEKKYCVSKKSPNYVIISMQEKVYDATFAHLIEQSYNARPAAPKTFYGQCAR